MKTKTIKTPSVGLTLILSICDKCYGSVIKSTLFCGGIGEPKAIEGNEMLQKAFELGKSILHC